MKRTKAALTPAGGMMDTPAFTPKGWARQLLNCFYRTGSYVWRASSQMLNGTAYIYPLVWLGANKTVGPGAPTWTLLGATGGQSDQPAHFVKMVGSAFAMIPYNGVAAPVFLSGEEWRVWEDAPVSDEIRYACRRTSHVDEAGPLFHVTGDQVTVAGIATPPTPAVIDSAGAGVLPAGDYPVAMRYKTSDGMYSPWTQPIIATIALNKKRSWTVVASTHPRVDGIQLGVGFPSGDVRNVYLIAEIANANAVYEEDVLPAAYDIGVPADFDLQVPPDSPEDVSKWDSRLWLISNDPEPLLWNSTIDASGASLWELFNPLAAQKLPIGGGQRYQCFKPWDRTRAAVLTDGSAHIVEPTSSDQYTIESLDDNHGCVSANAADVGGGYLVWWDGRNLLASQGRPGDAVIISRGWVDRALSQIPTAYAERVVVKYVPNDGGSFWVCIPSTADSTSPDLAICWQPRDNGWHKRKYLGEFELAPIFLAQIPSPEAGWYTVGCFDFARGLAIRLDAPGRRDQGVNEDGEPLQVNIEVEIETGQVEVPDAYGTVAVAREHIGIRRRSDANLDDPAVKVSCEVSLSVNGVETTPVVAALEDGAEYISALAQNLAAPASDVTVVIRFDHPDAMEVFDVIPEAILYQRAMART